MADKRTTSRSGRTTRSTTKAIVDFDPDRIGVLTEVSRPEIVPGVIGPPDIVAEPPEAPTHRFRVLRPEDLVVLDVRSYRTELVKEDEVPYLVPSGDGDGARLEIHLSFQHLGERAFYRAGAPPPAPGSEPATPPPIEALAAQGSRLVYDIPVGERIRFDIAGVLEAMSRLPLRVAPLATPRATAGSVGGLGSLTDVIVMPGNVVLGRAEDGTLAVVPANATTKRAVEAEAKLRSGAENVIARAVALRTGRALLSTETALDLSKGAIGAAETASDGPTTRAGSGTITIDPRTPISSVLGRTIRDLVAEPVRPPTIQQRPRVPRPDETAIEAPFRLILSPSNLGGFKHSLQPAAAPDDPKRVELWHTRLGVRKTGQNGSVTIDENANPQRVVRAIWARDKIDLGPDVDAPQGETPFRMSLNPRDRVILVRQTADPKIAPPKPVEADRFYLSSLGAFLDLHARWTENEIQPYAAAQLASILAWDHEAPMGRDQYVRVVYPGYFFPFGHTCALVKVTERKIESASNPQAHLLQRKFIVVSQPVRTFNDRRMPFRQISIRPLVTPDIRDPLAQGTPFAPGGEELFFPVVGNGKFYFTLDCIDWDGRRVRLQSPLLFVAAHLPTATWTATKIRDTWKNDPETPIEGDGQTISYAAGTVPGDTSFESVALRFDGTPGSPGSLSSTPFLTEADVVIPAMRHLAPSAPKTTVRYAQTYLDLGFTGKNAEPQVFFELKNPTTISFSQGTDRAGGFVQPDLPVRGLSRLLGAVGDIDDLVNKPAAQRFNPEKFLDGVLPKLFGLFELTDILKVLGLDAAPSFITEQLDRVAAMLADLEALKDVVDRGVARLADDASRAATSALQAQAQAARDRLDEIREELEPAIDQLLAAIDQLLDLGSASDITDVTGAVSDLLDAVAAQVTALRNVVRSQPLPPPVKAELERLINALEPVFDAARIADTIDAIAQFVNGFDPSGAGIRARFDWRPRLTNFPDVPDDDALFIVRPDGFLLSVDARASGSDGVGVDVLAELRDFALNLFPTAPLMRLGFDRLAFRASSSRKPEVDVVFRGIEFVGVLGFIERLKQLIPFDGFSDPPYVDVSPAGVTAGFSVGLPSVAVGVFSLENISLGADARVPFLGHEALTIGFNFCTREKPFRLTVMMIGGGGFVAIRLSPRGLVVLEMALEAGASLSVDFGVASGSVSVAVGIYLRLEADAGSLTGYFRIRGEVDVLGLISASITLELSLTYDFPTGKMIGKASLVIEVEVLFFSASVKITCERRLAGSNGDPTLEQVMGVLPDGTSPAWSQYCAAYAEA